MQDSYVIDDVFEEEIMRNICDACFPSDILVCLK